MTRNRNLIKLGDAIKQIFKEEKLDEKYSIFAIRNGWEGIVGKTVAKHTTEIQFAKGVLFITIDSAIIRNEMAFAKDSIIEKINQFTGKPFVKELVLK
ncbi:MAG: DUF721 domain-containing protein [Bacteroidia bacterium]|nr:DUF721 domain-containing protein [Bacteroidia bacterium]